MIIHAEPNHIMVLTPLKFSFVHHPFHLDLIQSARLDNDRSKSRNLINPPDFNSKQYTNVLRLF